jgi:hypothetical protein
MIVEIPAVGLIKAIHHTNMLLELYIFRTKLISSQEILKFCGLHMAPRAFNLE